MPIASSTLHGLFTWPEMQKILVPVLLRPADAGEPRGAAPQDGRARPRCVSTLLTVDRAAIEPDRRPGTAASAAAGPSCPRGFRAAPSPRRRYRRRRRDAGRGRNRSPSRRRSCRSGRPRRPRRSRPAGDSPRCRTRRGYRCSRRRAHADAGEQAALDQLVRIVAEDVAVLAGAGLAFVGVDDEIARPVACLRHERPFETGRETGAAAAAQPRILTSSTIQSRPLRISSLVPSQSPRARAPARRQVVLAVEIGEDAVLVSAALTCSPRNSGRGERRRPPAGAEPWRPVSEPSGGVSPRASASISFSVDGAVEVLVEIVVDLQDRRVDAGAEALDLDQRELSVGRGLADPDAELLLAGRDDFVRAAQPARRRRADLQRNSAPPAAG